MSYILHKVVNILISIFICTRFAAANEIKFTDFYKVKWYQAKNDSITFELTLEHQFGYIGFGISQNGGMRGADIVGIFPGPGNSTTAKLKDMHGIGNMRPVMDKSQDYKLESMHRNGTTYHFKISRLINTCDPEDLEITLGSTQYLIWSCGNLSTSNDTNNTMIYHGMMRGAKAVNLLDRNMKTPDFSQYNKWSLYQNITLTRANTLYWCRIHRAPTLQRKHHIVGFSINLDDPLAKFHTHHASVLGCIPPPEQEAETFFGKYMDPEGFDCYFPDKYYPVDRCKIFDFQWAYGGMPTMFPDNVGVPLGEKDSMFYMTMLHINNPEKTVGTNFTSGFDLYYTEKLRDADVGFFQIGINSSKAFALTVPPNARDYVLSSHCPPECMRSLPSSGVNVFVYLLHFHLTGRKMRVRHFRNGVELPWLANDENYDTNFQNNRLLRNEVKILPNDHLTVECTYDSTDRNGSVVIGGRSIMDEMCQAFLMYYPKTEDLNRCGSSISQRQMLDFMGIQKARLPRAENDPIVVEPLAYEGLPYTTVVEKFVNWTVEKRWAYQQMTRYNYHEAECTALGKGNTFSTKYPEIQQAYIPVDECKLNGRGNTSSHSGPMQRNVYPVTFFPLTTILAYFLH